MSITPGDSEGMLRYTMLFRSNKKYETPITEKELGRPSKRFRSFASGEHKDDQVYDPEFASQLCKGFDIIGEEHHEKTIGRHCFRCCTWAEWSY